MNRIAALQIGSSPEGTQATLERVLGRRDEIADAKLDLVVFPEALLGGYPKGADFGARVGYRTPEGREDYLRYHRQAIDLDGPEVKALSGLARDTGTALVVGAIERTGSTLYCVALFFDASGVFVGRHRKLMPTASERLVWGQGDGSTLTTMETGVGRVGAAICWENYMPLFRSAMYDKQLSVWCAPTVDEREIWQSSMRHIAYEGRCFVVSACQVQPPATEVLGGGITLRDRPASEPMIRGGSCIVSPFGEITAGPLRGEDGLVVAEIDLDDIVRARFDLDVTGHYARPDVFQLTVRECTRAFRSGPLDPRRIAASTGVVRLDVSRVWICEEAFDDAFEFAAFHHVRVQHHVVGVERAQRHSADPHDLRDLVDRVVGGLGTFADEDCVARPVGRVGGLMRVVEQQRGFAGFEVANLDTVGEAGLPIDDVALDALRREFVVGQPEEVPEGVWAQARDPE